MRLDEKVAIVTGSSRGVGKAVALAFAAEGARIIVNFWSSRNAAEELAAAENVTADVRLIGSDAVSVEADVATPEGANRIAEAAMDTFGRIDILVNNAGFIRPAMMLKMTEDQWDEVVDVHLKGAFLCAQAAARRMKEAKGGKIINVTSVAGIVGTIGQVNYSAAKGGIISLTKSMARELAPYGVCANVISLGIVATDMTEKIRTDEKLREIYMNRILLKRFAEAGDISPAFTFLASDESDYITGQLLCVDGGYGMV